MTHLSSMHCKQVQENRMYIGRMADFFRFTVVHGIGQRVHGESLASENKGNFLVILTLFGKYDETVKNKLKDGSTNATYVSHTLQAEILGIRY